MKDDFPKSDNVDILLLLEGTYPFVTGGVSTWVHNLIKLFPHYRFGVVFLGGSRKDYKGILYDIPENVVHLEAHYLFDLAELQFKQSQGHHNPHVTYSELAEMHHTVASYTCTDYEKIKSELNNQLFSDKSIQLSDFMESETSWKYTVALYQDKCPRISFLDYFWSVRNLHIPLWKLIEIEKSVPQTKILHSISTGYAGFLGALIHFQRNFPFIISEHGIYVKEREIDLLGQWCMSSAQSDERSALTQDYLTSMWIKYFSTFAKISYSAAMIIVSLFDEYRQRQIKDGAPPEKTRIVANGVKYHDNIIAKSSPNTTSPIIALIGRVVPIKDIKTFIRTMKVLIRHIPDAKGWIVGPMDEDSSYTKQCQNLVKVLQMEDVITFKGKQNVNELFKEIDIVVLSSISEGLPLVVIEAFSAGIPTITTDVGACKELIYGKSVEDKSLGVAGEVVEIANANTLANAIEKFVTNPEKWKQAQAVGRERVKLYYSENIFVQQYREIYDEAIKKWQE